MISHICRATQKNRTRVAARTEINDKTTFFQISQRRFDLASNCFLPMIVYSNAFNRYDGQLTSCFVSILKISLRLFCLARRCSQHRSCCVKEPYLWGFSDTCSNCTACVWRSTLISLALKQYNGSLLNDILISLISPIVPSQMTVVRELRGFFVPHHLHRIE